MEGAFSFSEVEYDAKSTIDVERKILVGGYSQGLGADYDLILQAGLILESKYENIDDEGKGFLFGGGSKFQIHRDHGLVVTGYGLFNYLNESLEVGDEELKVTVWDIHGGAIALFPLPGKPIQPYAGLDLAIISDGEIDFLGSESDFERDDLINIKLGLNWATGSITVRPEFTIIGEQTVTIAIMGPTS
jgi:hypothetical protein